VGTPFGSKEGGTAAQTAVSKACAHLVLTKKLANIDRCACVCVCKKANKAKLGEFGRATAMICLLNRRDVNGSGF